MKRREFLSLISTVGAGAALGSGAGLAVGGLNRSQLAGGSIHFSHRRQGFGYPVGVTLELPNVGLLDEPPSPLVVREKADGWFEYVGPSKLEAVERDGRRWRWEWTPPPVAPTSAEVSAEVIRYRLVLLDEEQSVGLSSRPLEVVCAQRGWGC
jgi:hypothetical protein